METVGAPNYFGNVDCVFLPLWLCLHEPSYMFLLLTAGDFSPFLCTSASPRNSTGSK